MKMPCEETCIVGPSSFSALNSAVFHLAGLVFQLSQFKLSFTVFQLLSFRSSPVGAKDVYPFHLAVGTGSW